jgi:hypothetical protein
VSKVSVGGAGHGAARQEAGTHALLGRKGGGRRAEALLNRGPARRGAARQGERGRRAGALLDSAEA